MKDWLHQTWVGFEGWRLAGFAAVLVLLLLAGIWSRTAAIRAARRLLHAGQEAAATWMHALGESALLGFLALGLSPAFSLLNPPDTMSSGFRNTERVIIIVAVAALFYQMVEAVEAALQRRWTRTGNAMDQMLGPLLRKTIRIAIVILAVVQIAQTLSSTPVFSLLAGLGVGGLAVALAAQDTIKNFFGSMVLLADKPFDIGQRIQVDGHDGTVESVGFRSTRIRTLDGNQVSIPNGELANRTLLNIGRRSMIRRSFVIGLPYSTPPEKVAQAKIIVQELLKDHEGSRPEHPPRVYFSELAPAALNLQVTYWYYTSDYWAYMAHAEKLNFEILGRFNTEGIAFAFPAQIIPLVEPGGGK